MLKRYNTVQKYLDDTLDFLLENAVEYNIPLGSVLSVPDKTKLLKDTLLLNVFRNGKLTISVFKNRPNIILMGESWGTTDIIELTEYLKKVDIFVRGVLGDPDLAIKFSNHFHPNYSIDKKIIAHHLRNIYPIELSDGHLELCQEKETALITEWAYLFWEECKLPPAPSENFIPKMIEYYVHHSYMYKWVVDGQIVSICAEAAKNEYFSKISYVYTPSEFRKRNYARSCVWTLTKKILDDGQKTVCLFTDSVNKTSNKIYREIGFEPVGECLEISFL